MRKHGTDQRHCKGGSTIFKGYGFLGYEHGADVFVHYISIESAGYKSLKEGDQSNSDILHGDSGRPQADKVLRIAG